MSIIVREHLPVAPSGHNTSTDPPHLHPVYFVPGPDGARNPDFSLANAIVPQTAIDAHRWISVIPNAHIPPSPVRPHRVVYSSSLARGQVERLQVRVQGIVARSYLDSTGMTSE